MACCVPNCKNVQRLLPPESEISFHRLPEGEMFKKYLLLIRMEHLTWKSSLRICSAHFTEEDFIVKGGRKCLGPNALPFLNIPESDQRMEDSILPEMSSSSGDGSRRGSKRQLDSSGSGTSSGTRRKRVKFIQSIHSYSSSLEKFRSVKHRIGKKIAKKDQKLAYRKKVIKSLRQQIQSLKQVIVKLRNVNLVSTTGVEYLERSLDGVPKSLILRYIKNSQRGAITRELYPPDLRKFAMTLNFFSSRAYEYVRKEFKLALPHQATIRKWYTAVNCEPGFQQISLNTLNAITKQQESKGFKNICSLMFDEIAIKKKIDINGFGYVDFGIPSEDDDREPASEALVFMVVSLTQKWKLPIGYFFIKSLNGQEKANLVKEALIRLNEVGVIVPSITCDGPNTNFAMFKELGCDWSDLRNIRPCFSHPTTKENVYAIFDAAHMLKLLRNHFSTLNIIVDGRNEMVRWDYIVKLQKLQEEEGLKIAAKLKKNHINWENQKMKVNLAAQVFSNSVAKALEFLKNCLMLDDFKDSQATINFLERINNVFDVLNSINPFGKNFKSPLRQGNEFYWRPYLLGAQNELLLLRDNSGNYLCASRKKTPIIGMLITISSIIGIYDEFVKTNKIPYLLTYKCSQDHLELFFCCVRTRNGWNNNPSCQEFYYSFKKLLLHGNIPNLEGGNAKVLDTTVVLSIPSSLAKYNIVTCNTNRYKEIDINLLQEHDYMLPTQIPISMYAENVVTYICGYVIRMTTKIVHCNICLNALHNDDSQSSNQNYKFVLLKNMGGLIIPSRGVVDLCMNTETLIRKIMFLTENKIPSDKNIINNVTQTIFEKTSGNINNLFPTLKNHFMENDILDEHPYFLIKIIIKSYVKIRLYNLAKLYNEKMLGSPVRQKLNKLILFSHQ